jgi:hypothetical protein
MTRLTVGSPLRVIHQFTTVLLPPLWILSLLWLTSFALLGGAAGSLLSCPHGNPQKEAALWRGSTFMVLAVMFGLDWYTLLFGKLLLVPSCLCLLLAAASAAVCAWSWLPLRKSASASALLFSLWQIYVFFLQTVVLLRA